MSKKKLVKEILDLMQNVAWDKSTQNYLIDDLKNIAKQVLTVESYEEIFGVKLKER